MKQTAKKYGPHGRPPAGKNGDKREHILDSALNLFAGQGIAGTTIAQVAKAAGVTPAMVHYYFTNREGLLDAIVAERLAPVIAYIWADISEKTLNDPRRVVTELVNRLLETVGRMPQLPFLWSREVLHAGGLLRRRVMSLIPVERFETLSRYLSGAQREGLLNARAAPALVFISVLGVIMLPLAAQDILGRTSAGSALNRETLRRHVLALLLDGLCPQPEPEAKP